MEEVRRIMAELDWSPLWISMKTGVVATVISFFLGIYAARKSVQAGPRDVYKRQAYVTGTFHVCSGYW